jgi:hypothetical protein
LENLNKIKNGEISEDLSNFISANIKKKKGNEHTIILFYVLDKIKANKKFH